MNQGSYFIEKKSNKIIAIVQVTERYIQGLQKKKFWVI